MLLVTGLPALVAVRALHDTLRWQERGAVVAVAVAMPVCRGVRPVVPGIHSQKLHRKHPMLGVPCSRIRCGTLQFRKGAASALQAVLCQQASPGGVNAADRRLNAGAAKARRTGKLGPWPALGGSLQAGHARVRGSGLDRQDFGAAARVGEVWERGGSSVGWVPGTAGSQPLHSLAVGAAVLEAGRQLRTPTGVPGQPGTLLMPRATPCTHSCVGVVKAWRAEAAA